MPHKMLEAISVCMAGVPASRLYPERPELADLLLVAVTETATEDDARRLEEGLWEALS